MEILEKYIDDVKIRNLKDDTEWLKSVLNDCCLVEENMESVLSISTNMTKEILKNDYIKPINVRLTNLSMDGIFKVRFERILNSTKKSIYEKNEVDILLKKEEEKIVELNALQVQLYGKNAVQDYRDMKENRSIEEVIDSIIEIKYLTILFSPSFNLGNFLYSSNTLVYSLSMLLDNIISLSLISFNLLISTG